MSTRDLFSFCFKSIFRGRTRSVLAAMAVTIGVFAIVLISSLGEGGKTLILEEVERLGISGLTVYANDSDVAGLALEDVELVASMKDVEKAMPVVFEYAEYSFKGYGGSCLIWGVSEQMGEVMDLTLLHGRLFNASDVSYGTQVALVDDAFAQMVYGRTNVVGKTVSVTLPSGRETFEIAGVIRSQKSGLNSLVGGGLPEFIYLPYTTLSSLTGKSGVDQIAISCMAGSDLDQTGQRVVQRLDHRAGLSNAFQVQNISAYRENLENITDLVALLIGAIAAISLVVAGLCVMNSMLSSATERRQEIGICMAVGARKRDILRCFLLESALISGIGGAIGIGAGEACSLAAALCFGIPSVVTGGTLLLAETIAVGFGMLFGILPALHAAKLDPILALKRE